MTHRLDEGLPGSFRNGRVAPGAANGLAKPESDALRHRSCSCAPLSAPPSAGAAPRLRSISRRTLLIGGMGQVGAMLFASPIQATGFDAHVADLGRMANRNGHAPDLVARVLRTITYDRHVAKLATDQPEFVKPVWQYVDDLLSENRIRKGRENGKRWAKVLRAIEHRYGVDRFTVLAIWGVETTYGAVLKNLNVVRPVFRSLASLGFADTRRRAYARTQFMAALKIAARAIISVENMRGSWAGAMGHTQFIPTTYLAHAVDFTGDGQADIWRAVSDALASTANYLAHSGWRHELVWGVPVVARRGLGGALKSPDTRHAVRTWHQAGFRTLRGETLPQNLGDAELYLPAGAAGPAFLLSPNFKALMAYNNSRAYSLAVSMLADILRGASAPQLDWSKASPPLSRSERRELQRRLNALGFGAGAVDGRIGPRSRAAVKAYQNRHGLAPDGYPSKALMQHMRQHS